MENIEHNGKILAMIIRQSSASEGVHFVTNAENSLQLGVLRYPTGFQVKPHIHKESVKTIHDIQEVLHVESGEMKATFYDAEGNRVGDTILNCGDTILLVAGGHGFDILQDTQMLEVKQGPYHGVEEDKVHFA